MINYLKSFTQVCNSKQEKHSNSLQTFRLQFILHTYRNGQGSMQTNGEPNTVNLVRCQQNLSSSTVNSVPFISDKTLLSCIDLFPVLDSEQRFSFGEYTSYLKQRDTSRNLSYLHVILKTESQEPRVQPLSNS